MCVELNVVHLPLSQFLPPPHFLLSEIENFFFLEVLGHGHVVSGHLTLLYVHTEMTLDCVYDERDREERENVSVVHKD